MTRVAVGLAVAALGCGVALGSGGLPAIVTVGGDTVPVYGASDVDLPPERVGGPELRYPEALRQRGCEGEVTLAFIVLPNGRVDSTSIAVVRSEHPDFSVAAIASIAGSVYSPGRLDGVPVPVGMRERFTFETRSTDGRVSGSRVAGGRNAGLLDPSDLDWC